MLRLLKDGTYQSRRKLASVLGYSERQLGRWFDAYRSGWLEALLNRDAPGGRSAKATPEAWAGLVEEMKAGQVARPEDAGRSSPKSTASDTRASVPSARCSKGAA
jgi:hypothetical protein